MADTDSKHRRIGLFDIGFSFGAFIAGFILLLIISPVLAVVGGIAFVFIGWRLRDIEGWLKEKDNGGDSIPRSSTMTDTPEVNDILNRSSR